MKIAFIMPSMAMGGAERVISILSKGLVEKGHCVCIGMFNIVPQTSAYALDERVELDNIQSCRFTTPTQIKNTLGNLEAYLKRKNPDVVISFINVTCAQVSIACKKMGIPIIFSERNDPRRYLTGIKDKIFQQLLIWNVRDMVFQTEGAKRIYPKRIGKRSRVILNPVDTSKFPPYYEGERKKEIVSVGRLERQKRHDVLIRAFAIVAEKYPELVLKIYGQGAQEAALQELIRQLQLEGRVLLMGTRNNIFDHINDAAAFVMSSDFEGLPNALIEAMALGLPCVSTRCSPGGAEELIQDGENGYLAPCGDPEQLAQAIIQLFDNYENSLEMGKKACEVRLRVEKQAIIDSWERYIYGVVNHK